MEQENVQLHFDLQIEPVTQEYITSAAKWAKFIAIVGFVFICIFLLFTILTGTALMSDMDGLFGNSNTSSAGIGILVVSSIIIIALWFIPCMFLYRFASRMQQAITSLDQQQMNESFINLKSFFKFVGVCLICIIAFYIIILIAGLATAALSSY